MAVAGDSEVEERETDENKNKNNTGEGMSRKEKRNFLKKMKRKQLRRETAIKEREIMEAVLDDPEEQSRLLRLEQDEAERMERDRREFEERERLFLLALELKKKQQHEEDERRKRDEDQSKLDLVNNGDEQESNEGDDWEYVEEGPAEIIWKGNEIIVKKKKVKVPKKVPDLQLGKQESERPISNPLAPQSEAFEDYRSAQDVLESVAQEVPNFGTEQDKAHCPFHLKTGVCRFGARCSRVHFYPDKSCTLLIKNMYSGPGLAWQQDEGLEYTDEEVERSFEEFYEDVHTEFLKFGEIVNFKVCKNASSHLRGNVYVHYKVLESAVLAYQSINARYFAGKQLSCEFINLTKWKVAICGEFMKSRLKTCSRGSVCNFIHCFRNPGGDYEWADWGKPPPRYWQQEMDALFGDTNDRFRDESLQFVSYPAKRARSRAPDTRHRNSLFDVDDHRSRNVEHHRGESEALASSPDNCSLKRRNTERILSYPSKRSRSKAPDSPHVKSHFDEDVRHRTRNYQLHRSESEEKPSSPENCRIKRIKPDSIDKPNSRSDKKESSRRSSNSERESDQRLTRQDSVNREHLANATDNDSRKREVGDRSLELKSRTSSRRKSDSESIHDDHQSSEKTYQFDMRKSPRGDRHRCKSRRHESKDSLQKKKEAYSSDVDSDEDYLSRNESKRRGRKRSHVKDDAYLSDCSFHEDRYGRDGRSPKRKSSKSHNRSGFHEFKRRDSLERKEDKYHKSSADSSRATEHIETDGKKPQRSRSQSKRPDNQSDITDSEGERCRGRTDGRYTRNAKNGRQVKHRAESSDSDSDGVGARRYEKKSRKHRILGSEPKNDLVQSHLSGLNREKRHDEYGKRNDMLNIEECGSSKVDCDAYKRSLDYDKPDEKKQADVSNDGFEFGISGVAPHGNISEQDNVVNGHCSSSENTAKSYLTNPGFHDQSSSKCGAESHGTCSKCLESTKDQTIYDMDIESTSPVKKCNGTTTPQTVAACFRSTGCLNNEPDTELEKTCRMAALKKLEEMTKSKDVRTVQGRNLNIGAEVHSHAEGSKDLEDISGSGEVGTTAAAAERRRI